MTATTESVLLAVGAAGATGALGYLAFRAAARRSVTAAAVIASTTTVAALVAGFLAATRTMVLSEDDLGVVLAVSMAAGLVSLVFGLALGRRLTGLQRAATTAESLAGLRPAFRKDGTITAGSASQISDGAAAVVVMSKAKAQALGLTWLAEIGAAGYVAGPDSTLQSQPAHAIRKACAKEGITPADLDLLELNEAFAAVGLASTKELGVDPDKVNVNGGAIAMGHPVGMSGARIVLHLANELKRRGGGVGAAALCGGGGQGDALIVRVPKA